MLLFVMLLSSYVVGFFLACFSQVGLGLYFCDLCFSFLYVSMSTQRCSARVYDVSSALEHQNALQLLLFPPLDKHGNIFQVVKLIPLKTKRGRYINFAEAMEAYQFLTKTCSEMKPRVARWGTLWRIKAQDGLLVCLAGLGEG